MIIRRIIITAAIIMMEFIVVIIAFKVEFIMESYFTFDFIESFINFMMGISPFCEAVNCQD